MTLTINEIAKYLGDKASHLLADPPFKNWHVTKSYEKGLDKSLVDYVFAGNGIDFVCDAEDERIRTIFIYSDELRYFKEEIKDFSLLFCRQEVVARLGEPYKSGKGFRHQILGDFGAWDLFSHSGYFIHAEYRVNEDSIKKLTLMRSDAVP